MVLTHQQNVKLFLLSSLYDTIIFSKVLELNDINLSYLGLHLSGMKHFHILLYK